MALSVAGTAVIADPHRLREPEHPGPGGQPRCTRRPCSSATCSGSTRRRPSGRSRRAARPLPDEPREIRFENVTFTYPGDATRPALDDVPSPLPLGRIVALVGENGSGKTTLVKLLAGLYTPDRGADPVGRRGRGGRGPAPAGRADRDGRAGLQAVAVHGPRQRRDRPFLGAAHRGAAGRVGRRGRAPRRWSRTCRAAWTRCWPGNFSGGHELSGGQWQRLGIARAAYRRGRILIVDEPTAALDARAELEVFEKIRALADTGQTVVLITHRLASVRHADLVHVLDQGRLVESGHARTSCWRAVVSTPSCTRSRPSSSRRRCRCPPSHRRADGSRAVSTAPLHCGRSPGTCPSRGP